jgi:hypothetical protein
LRPLILIAAVLALPAAGQAIHSLPSAAMPGATGARAPYTADFKISLVKHLANGTTINGKEDVETRAVDAQGREMTRRKMIRICPYAEGVTVTVFDPVAHTSTSWDSLTKVATVQSLGEGNDARSARRSVSHPIDHRKPTVEEDLGVKTINGVEAHGSRITTTLRGQPFARVTERWTAVAADLEGLTVRDTTFDPRFGTQAQELTRLTRGDPDPALFSPPPDYEIGRPELSFDPQSGKWSEKFIVLRHGDGPASPPPSDDPNKKHPPGEGCSTESTLKNATDRR